MRARARARQRRGGPKVRVYENQWGRRGAPRRGAPGCARGERGRGAPCAAEGETSRAAVASQSARDRATGRIVLCRWVLCENGVRCAFRSLSLPVCFVSRLPPRALSPSSAPFCLSLTDPLSLSRVSSFLSPSRATHERERDARREKCREGETEREHRIYRIVSTRETATCERGSPRAGVVRRRALRLR